jgi:hypothetical protein
MRNYSLHRSTYISLLRSSLGEMAAADQVADLSIAHEQRGANKRAYRDAPKRLDQQPPLFILMLDLVRFSPEQ